MRAIGQALHLFVQTTIHIQHPPEEIMHPQSNDRNRGRGEHDNRDDGEREGRQQDERGDTRHDELLTLAEVARLLRVSPATVRYWRHQHTGPLSFRIGRHVRYRRCDVLNWIARQIKDGSGDAA